MNDGPVWSGTDFPYQCLKDAGRTRALMQATAALVSPGDSVLDLGAGSGILSFAAAAAGAQKVYSVELDASLADALRRSARANGFEDIIEVVEGDALELDSLRADVLLAELIDTGLMDEQFVPALNQMWATGIVTDDTRLLFREYRTTVQLVDADNCYYGFTVLAPKHEWPFYDSPSAGSGWVASDHRPVGLVVETWRHDFTTGATDTAVGPILIDDDPRANAIVIAGTAVLGDGQELGAYNSFNGIKVIPIEERPAGTTQLSIAYEMGAGLHTFSVVPA